MFMSSERDDVYIVRGGRCLYRPWGTMFISSVGDNVCTFVRDDVYIVREGRCLHFRHNDFLSLILSIIRCLHLV